MAARVFGASRALMAAARSAAGSGSSARATTGKAKVSTNKGGIMKALPVSPAMRKFLGVSEISRSEAVKKIWDYIKLHQLQNPVKRTEINCDERLKAIFDGKDKVGMLEIAKLIGSHFVEAK